MSIGLFCAVPSPVEKVKWWPSVQLYVVAHWCHSDKKTELLINIVILKTPEEVQK